MSQNIKYFFLFKQYIKLSFRKFVPIHSTRAVNSACVPQSFNKPDTEFRVIKPITVSLKSSSLCYILKKRSTQKAYVETEATYSEFVITRDSATITCIGRDLKADRGMGKLKSEKKEDCRYALTEVVSMGNLEAGLLEAKHFIWLGWLQSLIKSSSLKQRLYLDFLGCLLQRLWVTVVLSHMVWSPWYIQSLTLKKKTKLIVLLFCFKYNFI